jgi:tRNA ligase
MSTTVSDVLSHPLAKSEDSDLIVSLYALSNKSPKLVKSTAYPAPADPSIEVRSWKMNEHKYYDVPSPFPTLARGIFSVKIPQQEKDGKQGSKYRIVARGYDKFFNIGEVPWNTVHILHLSPLVY